VFAAGGDGDGLLHFGGAGERVACQFQDDAHLFFLRQIVVDVRRENNLVAFDKEPGRLQANNDVLASDDLG
jgi:hypothetical protein